MIVTDATELANRLREARERAGITQERAATALGLPRTAITKIERGARAVSAMELSELADLYRTNIRTLLGQEDDGTWDQNPRRLEQHFGVTIRGVRQRLGWHDGLPDNVHDYSAIKILELVLAAVYAEQEAAAHKPQQ